jgi:hypothetical protein
LGDGVHQKRFRKLMTPTNNLNYYSALWKRFFMSIVYPKSAQKNILSNFHIISNIILNFSFERRNNNLWRYK